MLRNGLKCDLRRKKERETLFCEEKERKGVNERERGILLCTKRGNRMKSKSEGHDCTPTHTHGRESNLSLRIKNAHRRSLILFPLSFIPQVSFHARGIFVPPLSLPPFFLFLLGIRCTKDFFLSLSLSLSLTISLSFPLFLFLILTEKEQSKKWGQKSPDCAECANRKELGRRKKSLDPREEEENCAILSCSSISRADVRESDKPIPLISRDIFVGKSLN